MGSELALISHPGAGGEGERVAAPEWGVDATPGPTFPILSLPIDPIIRAHDGPISFRAHEYQVLSTKD